MWRCQQEVGHPTSSSYSKRRQIPPDVHGLCLCCFEEGHHRQDCTIDPLCRLSGHVSSQCKRLHIPISAEELHKAVIAKASRARPTPQLDRDKERRLLEPRQSAPCALPTSVAPSPPPVPSYLPGVTTPSEVCIIQRSASLDDLERRLQLSVVAYVGGTRPPVSCEDATMMLAAQLDIPRYRFSIQKYFPEDFLVSVALQLRMANRVVVSDPGRFPNGSQSRLVVPTELVVQAEERTPAGEFDLVKSCEMGVSDDRDKA
ncbi:hypothetical protein D1007_60584 [Hordeum vulgare]|nr:hypothetical protein D1007_60584 [Hordeum vulgare]